MAELIHPYFHRALAWFVLIVSVGITLYLLITGFGLGWIIFFLVLNPIIFGTKYRTGISLSRKEIVDEFYFAFIKTKSERIEFETLDKVVLEKERTAYKAAQRGRDRFADFQTYTAKIVFDETKTFTILESTDYNFFKTQIEDLATKISIPTERVF